MVLDADGAASALALWDAALATTWSGPDVWVHGDVAPGNLLLTASRISAVIDWGCCAVGDPACDLAIAWTTLDGAARDRFRRRLGVDDGTWLRGAGWALWKALVTLEGEPETGRANRDRADGARRTLAALLPG